MASPESGESYCRCRSTKGRLPFRYQAFVPDAIADWDEKLSPRAVEALSDATALLHIIQGSAAEDLEMLTAPLLRAVAQCHERTR